MQVDYKWKEKAEELELKLAAAEDKNQQLQAKLHGTELLRVIEVSETGIERQRTLKEHNKRIWAHHKIKELQAKLEALKPYIRHKSPCEFKTVGLSKCACGLLQALEQKP